jgi:hypothetical protein
MKTIADLQKQLDEYSATIRKPGLYKIQPVSGLFDLFPERGSPLDGVEHRWPDSSWPSADQPGIYAFLSETGEIIYIGKASMSNTLGSRLSAYTKYGEKNSDGSATCQLKHSGWNPEPRYVVTVGLKKEFSFEAPAIEEYLIIRLSPSNNTIGPGRPGSGL